MSDHYHSQPGDRATGDIGTDTAWRGLTPGLVPFSMGVRPGTSDWNTVNACARPNDEYHLPATLTGWALDVGAHIGACTIPLLLDNPGLRVIAIEALPENVALLLANAERNGVADRLTILQAAASDSPSPVAIHYSNDPQHRYIGNADDVPVVSDVHEAIMCNGVTLRGAQLQRGPDQDEPFVWAKIDCEGCEYAFLANPEANRLLAFITGEVHRGWQRLVDVLAPTHDIDGPGKDFGPFTATLRVAVPA